MKEVLPLAHTKPDWDVFNIASQEVLGRKITRVLDENHMTLDDFNSFVAVLDLQIVNPLQNLREGFWTNRTWDHVSISFVYTLDSDAIVEICSVTDLKIISFPVKKTNFSIITGTLADWFLACIRVCSPDAVKSNDTHDFITQCHTWLEKLGYQEIFNDFDRSTNDYNNLILRRK